MNIINVNVRNKIARSTDLDAFIVCGNSDYVIKFDFDADWDDYNIKTARFIYNGSVADVIFEGDSVNVPIIHKSTVLSVGVTAGDMRTTTPCLISCQKSIICDDGFIADPPPDVYQQLVEKLDNKVNKEEGKNLSTNDFTDELKEKYDGYENDILDLKNKDINIEGNLSTLKENTVKKTDYATGTSAGIVKVVNDAGSATGIYLDADKKVTIAQATKKEIKEKTQNHRPIVPIYLEYAVEVCTNQNAENPELNERLPLGTKATIEYVSKKLAEMIDSAPETLDTLNELAKALGDDPNFATTVATELGKKADKTEVKELKDDISDIDAKIGDIDAVLDELHNYARALVSGGVA